MSSRRQVRKGCRRSNDEAHFHLLKTLNEWSNMIIFSFKEENSGSSAEGMEE